MKRNVLKELGSEVLMQTFQSTSFYQPKLSMIGDIERMIGDDAEG